MPHERGDERRRIERVAHDDAGRRRARAARRRARSAPTGASTPHPTTASERTRKAARRRAAGHAGAPIRTASVRLPATTSVSTSRTLFTSRMPHAGKPDRERAPPRLGRQLQVLHVRAADRRDEAEEREHHDLAETDVAVRLRPAGVGDGRDDRGEPDEQQPRVHDEREHRAHDGGDARTRSPPRCAPRPAIASPLATSRTGPRRSLSVPRTPSE